MNINSIKLYKSFEYLLDQYARRRRNGLSALSRNAPNGRITYNLRFQDYFTDRVNGDNRLADIVSANLGSYSDILYTDSELRKIILEKFVEPIFVYPSYREEQPYLPIYTSYWVDEPNYSDVYNIIKIASICYIKEKHIVPDFTFTGSNMEYCKPIILRVLSELEMNDPEIEELIFEWRLK